MRVDTFIASHCPANTITPGDMPAPFSAQADPSATLWAERRLKDSRGSDLRSQRRTSWLVRRFFFVKCRHSATLDSATKSAKSFLWSLCAVVQKTDHGGNNMEKGYMFAAGLNVDFPVFFVYATYPFLPIDTLSPRRVSHEDKPRHTLLILEFVRCIYEAWRVLCNLVPLLP